MNLHEHTQLMKAAILFSFVYVTICGTAYSQKKEPELIDSLVSALPYMKDDTFKVNTLKKVAAYILKSLLFFQIQTPLLYEQVAGFFQRSINYPF